MFLLLALGKSSLLTSVNSALAAGLGAGSEGFRRWWVFPRPSRVFRPCPQSYRSRQQFSQACPHPQTAGPVSSADPATHMRTPTWSVQGLHIVAAVPGICDLTLLCGGRGCWCLWQELLVGFIGGGEVVFWCAIAGRYGREFGGLA
ncbi:hypothetical protein [Mycobacterium lepromatosis]|uniref:hypothetical protein n=1 Tax=Mycobacterium lepromatosis TaxID=480418 RepID=UPI0005F873F0|nr:hypothetical protein [Mycobacterium lepromatosis]